MRLTVASVLAACAVTLLAQTPPVTLLKVEVENIVGYGDDGTDPAKWASSPTMAPWPSALSFTFKTQVFLGDIVSINGKPAKGTHITRHLMLMFTPTYTPGRSIADFSGGGVTEFHFVIQGPDGTPIGNIYSSGLCGTVPPPGSPNDATRHNFAIVGGTGAYMGVRGQLSGYTLASGRATASMLEDPANRRTHGGGARSIRYLHLIPYTWPEVLTVPTGPAIFHGNDFSPVTAEKPARAGELLTMSVSGLGPVRPNLDPGTPFPPMAEGKVHAVNSPVEVTVNGKGAQVVNALGWPGMNNVYRVDFRVPEGAASGTATLGLAVAWINGPEVKFPVR